jgi:glyoxylase-like metal-dependent hydrolase (beta-lactamase superfamily II)
MAYCWEELLEKLETTLNGRSLDYILLTHTHYDHVGALPYIRDRYPQAMVLASEYAQKVLQKESARKVIGELGEEAARTYLGTEMKVRTDGLVVNQVVGENDEIDLGDTIIQVLETPGHTTCSLSYYILPEKILLASESTGILIEPELVHTAILKSYRDSLASGEKMKNLQANTIILPHYGVLPSHYNERYWELFFQTTYEKRDYIQKLYVDGLSKDEIIGKYIEKYWDDVREQEQPKAAFVLNAKSIIDVILKEI